MTADLLKAVTEAGGVVDLSDRTKILLTGEDRVRYLNGQVTNDVRKIAADKAISACVTNAKGRIEAQVFIHLSQSGEEGIWLDAEPGQREALSMRIDRYIISDDVTLTDVTDDWQIHHIFGPAAEPWLAKAGTEGILAITRFGESGVDVWFRTGTPAPETTATLIDAEATNALRILRSIPRWPEELNNEAFPQEAGLESTDMDFHKGCYIGQEILSRIKTTGKMPRQLVRFETSGTGEITTPSGELRLALKEGDGPLKDLGPVTSITRDPALDREIGLAYVRQGTDTAHSLLLVEADPPRIITDARIFSL